MRAVGAVVGALVAAGTLLFLLFIYLLPAYIADRRRHQHRVSILLFNLLLGWSRLGWALALVWCAMPVTTDQRSTPSLWGRI
jgi:hypothetical protein